jgi:molybdopterin converting factor small subunit
VEDQPATPDHLLSPDRAFALRPARNTPGQGAGPRPVRILYFAQLRDQRGLPEETLSTLARTPAELYAELARRFALAPPPEGMRVAVNDDFAVWDYRLAADDAVAFLPPFGGG